MEPARWFDLDNVRIPDASIEVGGVYEVVHKSVKNAVILHWPDGAPCILINQYLLDQSAAWSGQTARTYASDLSHLARYCFSHAKSFRDLSDGDIRKFIDLLISERKSGKNTPKRNHNTVRKIVLRSICFLEWCQKTVYRSGRQIVGTADRYAAITVVEKWNRHSKRMEWNHRYLPESVSRDPKLPIAWSTICKIDEAIERKGLNEVMAERLMRSHRFDKKFVGVLLDYLYARRGFLTWLLMRTGMRPGEMMLLSVQSLESAILKQAVQIPTLKRRRKQPESRFFKLTSYDVEFIRRYLMVRRIWLEACESKNDGSKLESSRVFLATAPGRLGRPISLSGLEKDFTKLCVEAGLTGEQVCFSMYRHRFITEQVRRLLKEFRIQGGTVVSTADYRAMLERVRAMTGHANFNSLWHYIHLARDDEEIWGAVELCEKLQSASTYHRAQVSEIARHLRNGTRSPNELADQLQEVARAFGDFF
jgi:site-specific recombinase XerD